MLIKQKDLIEIAAGRVTVAFRRWLRPTVRSGGRLRTSVGVLAIESVEAIALPDIAERDVRDAGFQSRAELLEDLASRSEGALYRIRFRLDGPDPRVKLRQETSLSEKASSDIELRLRRFDAMSGAGRWTHSVLALIAQRPGVRAAELATALNVSKQRLKTNIRKLKELGLTESLQAGYRLAPRGEAYLSSRPAMVNVEAIQKQG